MKNYIDIIRGLREDKDLTQTDIATILGTTQQHYSKYETGEYEIPVRVFVALADYYKVSVDFLLGRTDCERVVSDLNEKVVSGYSAGLLLSNVLSLSEHSRRSVVEYVDLQK